MKRLIASVLLLLVLGAAPASARTPARIHGWKAYHCLDIGFNEDGTPIIVC